MSVHSGTRKLDRLLFYGAIVGATAFSFVFTTTTTLSVGYTVIDFLHTTVLGVVGIRAELHL